MADARVTFDVVLSDPTTKSQQAAVDALGRVSVNTEFPDAAALADNAANPTTSLVGACLLGFDGTTWDRIYTVADGDAVAAATKGFLSLGSDGANYQVIAVNASGHVMIEDGGNVITVDGTVDTELPAAALLGDGTANPTIPSVGVFLHGYNGTTWDRVRVANTGRLQVDVVSGGGETLPTSPTVNAASTSALAAGASANLDSAEILATSYLAQCVISGSVPFKAVIQAVNNGVATTVATLFGGPGNNVDWFPAHRRYAQVDASVGVDVFRAAVTNMDASEAADFYAAFLYQQN